MSHQTKTIFVLLALVYSAVICVPIAEHNEQVGFSAEDSGDYSATAGSNVHMQQKPVLNALQQDALPRADESATVAQQDPQTTSGSASYMLATLSTVVQEPTSSMTEQAQVTSTAATSTSSASSSTSVSTISSLANPSPPALSPPVATPLAIAYYPDWVGDEYPPEKVDFGKFDWVDFAFAMPTADEELSWGNGERSPELLHRVTKSAHVARSKVKLSIGGWTGSKFFSPSVSSQQARQIFVNSIVKLFKDFDLDGIDIDWEYPAKRGETGNEVSATDSANFLAFLRLLRSALPINAIISAATQSFPFANPEGLPMTNVTEFAEVLDWITLMNYDVWGSSADSPGPNAPFYNSCGNSTQPEASALAGFTAWTEAGFPPSQIVLGVPSYGYISRSNAQKLRQRSKHENKNHSSRTQMQGSEKVTRDDGTGVIHVHSEDGGDQVQFRDLIKQGALVRNKDAMGNSSVTSDAMFVGGGGFVRQWDVCSGTPFLISTQGQGQVISYDDPESLRMKSAFVKKTGMLGVNMFDVHGDSDDWALVDAIRQGLEISGIV